MRLLRVVIAPVERSQRSGGFFMAYWVPTWQGVSQWATHATEHHIPQVNGTGVALVPCESFRFPMIGRGIRVSSDSQGANWSRDRVWSTRPGLSAAVLSLRHHPNALARNCRMLADNSLGNNVRITRAHRLGHYRIA